LVSKVVILFLNVTDVKQLRREKNAFLKIQQQKITFTGGTTISFANINVIQLQQFNSHQAED
jgi:hypothetical protein